MRTIIAILFFIPVFALSQNTDAFIKLVDARNQPIKGEALMKGYERAIQPTSFTNGGNKNTQLSFTMVVGGASADLKRAMAANEILPRGELVVLTPAMGGAPGISYTIKMENITVLSCTEIMGCNSQMNTTVNLQATRIGWTYYSQSRGGMATVSRKFGWDANTGSEWTNF